MIVPVSPVIRVNGGSAWDTRFAVFVLSGQEITIESDAGGLAQKWEGDGAFVTRPGTSTLVSQNPTSGGPVQSAGTLLTWRAPSKPGSASMVLRTADAEGRWVESARLNVQVMAPMNQLANGVLEGYRIGSYPRPSATSTVDYVPPVGFLKVSESAGKTPVSPRFNLEDFACKQTHSGVRYLALQPRLLPFLEAIAGMVEEKGFVSCAGVIRKGGSHDHDESVQISHPITIMSGYRTPAYNSSLGNVELSRHQYGDASDIIIDTNGDGAMDDLNRDGRVNGRDAITLAAWIENLWTRPEFVNCPGGLGIYNGTDEHGPFVHVDLRGQRARWGGNGLEWSDAAVSHAAAAPQDDVIQTASYTKTPSRTAKAAARSRTTRSSKSSRR
jgi:hypothetical protein